MDHHINILSGFIFLTLLKGMSYKFLAGVATGYVFSNRGEFESYRDVIEPYTDPYLDIAVEKIKDIKKTFDAISKEKETVVKEEKQKSYIETISEKFRNKKD